jgi:PAS domain S-box-containing protein
MKDAPAPRSIDGIDEHSVYRSVFAAYPDALLLVDAAGTIVLANPAAQQLLGFSAEEFVGMSVDALVPDSIRPRHAAYRDAYAHQPRPRPMGTQMELVAKRRDGSEVMVEIALSPLQEHGLPYVVAAIRGIGAYPRVKQALQRARYAEHLAQLGRTAVDTRDPKLLLQHVPEVAAAALEVEVAVVSLLEPHGLEFRIASGRGLELIGDRVGVTVPNSSDSSAGYVTAQGRPVVVSDYRLEQRFEVPPAYLRAGLLSALAVPLSDRGRTVGVLTVRSRQANRFGADEQTFLESLASMLATSLQRAQSEEALNHAQRLESVGQLTGGIAHDFNNLLTVIQGNLQVLEELPAVEGDEFAQQLVNAAARASRRGAELTSKLLAFSRRQVLSPKRIELPTMLHSLADMLRRTLDQRIRIEVQGESDLACLADPGQLESALLNIAINARDAMPEGGQLSFSARPCTELPAGAQGEVGQNMSPAAGYVAISVTDTGTGMPEGVKERALEPFFTTKAAGRGTGLGLSTVYGFVTQSHGAMSIETEPGAGTTITLFIPRDQEAGDELPTDAGGDQVPPGLRVLLVEDDAEVSAVARNFLQSMGCEVVDFPSGERALLSLDADSSYDLLLSDIALGAGMRGTEFARLAVQRIPGLSVLLMSGFSAELIDANRDVPMEWELLPKPYSRNELARAIARLCAAAG